MILRSSHFFGTWKDAQPLQRVGYNGVRITHFNTSSRNWQHHAQHRVTGKQVNRLSVLIVGESSNGSFYIFSVIGHKLDLSKNLTKTKGFCHILFSKNELKTGVQKFIDYQTQDPLSTSSLSILPHLYRHYREAP